MNKEFTKADLKDGMVVELRSGCRYILLSNKLLRLGGWMEMEYYTNNLCDRVGEKQIDIMKVFELVGENKIYDLVNVFNDKYLDLIWERKETKYMTVEEMRQKLEELTGEEIEVVNDDIALKFAELSRYCDKQPDCSKCIFNEKCPLKSPNDGKFIKECYGKVMEYDRENC